MRISRLYAPHFSENFNKNVSSYLETADLLKRADLVEYPFSGTYTLLPLGKKVVNKLKKRLKEKSDALSIQEIDLPVIQPKSIWESSGRWNRFEKEIITTGNISKRYILTPTNEEALTLGLRKGIKSYKQLPLHLYQVGEVFKGNTPSKGLIRSMVFEVYEAYSFDEDLDSLKKSSNMYRQLFEEIFKELNIKIISIESPEKDYTNFLLINKNGEHKLLSCGDHFYWFNSKNLEERCSECGKESKEEQGLSIAMYKEFGDEFSKKFNLTFTDCNGTRKFPLMGTYGLGISRLLYAVVDCNKDEDRIIWPADLAPYEFGIMPIDGSKKLQVKKAEQVYEELSKNKEVLLDDRNKKRIEGKKKSMRLIGIPKLLIVDENNIYLEKRSERKEKINFENLDKI